MKQFHLDYLHKTYLVFYKPIHVHVSHASNRKLSLLSCTFIKILAIVMFFLFGVAGKTQTQTNIILNADVNFPCIRNPAEFTATVMPNATRGTADFYGSAAADAHAIAVNNLGAGTYGSGISLDFMQMVNNGATSEDRNWPISDAAFTSGYGSGITIQYVENAFVSNNTIPDIDADAGIKDVKGAVTPGMSTDECTAVLYTWTGITDDDWNEPGNWCSNAVPSITVAVIIPAGTPNSPNIRTAAANAASVTLDAGAMLTVSNTQVLNIASAFTNNGSFVAGDGTVNFTAAATFSGNDVAFNNLVINGNLTLNAIPAINGVFIINGGQVLTNSPVYTSSSTLIYNITGAYTTGAEWNGGAAGTVAPGPGIPQNVIISNGIIIIPDAFGANRALAGNLTINSGSTLQMTIGSRDLYILGDWTNNGGIFNANGRTVDFNLTSAAPLLTQTITGTTTFYNLTFGNANIITSFGTSNTTVTNQFNNNAGLMAGGTSTVTLTGATGTIIGSAAKNFYDLQINGGAVITHNTGGGNIHISNSFTNNGSLTENTAYTFYFDQSGATESFTGNGTTNFGKLTIGDGAGLSIATILNASANFTVNGGAMTFFHNSIYNGTNNTAVFSTMPATVVGPGIANFYDAFTTVALNLGSGISTINHNLQLNPGGSVVTNAPLYASEATLTYNTTTASLPTNIEWTNNTGATGSGAPFNVTVQNANNVVMAGDRTVPGTLNIAAANTLAINDKVLTINTAISGAGTLTGSALSGLVLAGSAPALKFTSGGFSNYLKTFTLTGTANAVLASALNIAAGTYADPGTLTLNGAGSLDPGSNLTLKSDMNGDARIGYSTGSITSSRDVTVERYIPAQGQGAWRFLSVPFDPLYTAQSINAAWQEGETTTTFSGGCPAVVNTPAGLGTQITGLGNVAGSGYDFHSTNNASLRYLDGLSWQTPASSLTAKLTDHYGWYIFVRGDRYICLMNGPQPANETTLRAKGALNQKGGPTNAVVMNFSGAAGQWFMAGNPYASAINLNDVINSRAAGFDPDKIWVMDPKLGGNYGVGGYVTYSSGVWTPSGGSYPGGSGNSPILQSGQGFIVKTNAAAGQARFEESDKTATEWNVFGLTAKKTAKQFPVVYCNLMGKDTASLLDGVAAAFSQDFLEKVDSKDAQKLWNRDENITLVRRDTTLAIEFRPLVKASDTLFYRLYLRQQPYVLKVFGANQQGANMPDEAWLVDKYLGTQKAVNLYDTTLYAFTPNPDTNSYRNRFMLVFNRKDPGRPGKIDSVIRKIKARIYPNPVSGKTFSLVLENAKAGDYTINIFTTGGRLAAAQKVNYRAGSDVRQITVPATITAGQYVAEVLNNGKVVVGSMPFIVAP